MNTAQFIELRARVEDAKAAADRAEGAFNEILSRLQADFECKTIKEAKALLAGLEAKQDQAEKRFDLAVSDYEKKWVIKIGS